jgi:hypothetical protein
MNLNLLSSGLRYSGVQRFEPENLAKRRSRQGPLLQVSILQTFYAQLLPTYFQKRKKDNKGLIAFLHFWDLWV